MSLYLGKDLLNSSILHITSGINTVSQLKSGGLPNTVFHSNLGYIFTKNYSASYIGYYGTAPSYYHVYLLPDTFFNDIIGTTKGYCILFDNDKQLSQLNINISGLLTNEPYSPIYFRSTDISSASSTTSVKTGYKYLHFLSSSTAPVYQKVAAVIALLDDSGYIQPINNGGTDIIVTGSSFYVKGVNLNDYGYISPIQVNSRDVYTSATESTDGGIQFINSSVVSNVITELSSNSVQSLIMSNGYPIFSSLVGGSYNRYSETILTEFVYGSLYVCGPGGDGSTSRVIKTGMVTDQLFTCRAVSISSSSTTAINEYLQFYAFKPGTSVAINQTYVGYPAYAWAYVYIDMNNDMSLSVRLRFTVGGSGCGRSTYKAIKTNIMSF